ncbi:hypothetical protein [Poriferisphaera sp. WC338]|uniref:hypothetical protein n=1 Tax=Poriferisphaera sp. WC338 TaxID=3425129 RepID=UPI003D813B53
MSAKRASCRRVRSSFGNTVLCGAIFRIGQSGKLLWASDAARVVLSLFGAMDATQSYPSLNRAWVSRLWEQVDCSQSKRQTRLLHDKLLPCRACVDWNPHLPNGLTVSLWRIDARLGLLSSNIDPLWETILNKLNENKSFS